MYVPYERYEAASGSLSEEEYGKLAPFADLVIDDWTLERVGRTVRKGEELPNAVITLYCGIVDALPAVIEKAHGRGATVASFSNGIDSYSFVVDKTIQQELESSIGWMMNLLPIEWCSHAVYFAGGNEYAG